MRYSFATWLVPFVEKEVLQCDVIAGIANEGYQSLLALNDKVADAWRSDPAPGAADWAGRLAQLSGRARATIYNRRDAWRKKYGIDIAKPLQMYSDILYFGHNSIAKPENITAILVAVDQEDGSELVRLHAEELAEFEKKRVEIVNPALVNPPRAMELKPPLVALPRFDDLPPDFDDIGLDEVVPPRPRSARPNIPLSSAKSGPRELRQGLMKEPRKKVVLRKRRKPPSPPTEKRRSSCGPGATRHPRRPRREVILRARRSPSPPPTGRGVVLRARRKPEPPAGREGASRCGGEKNRLKSRCLASPSADGVHWGKPTIRFWATKAPARAAGDPLFAASAQRFRSASRVALTVARAARSRKPVTVVGVWL